MDNLGYVLAGYLLTGVAILAYTWSLFARARRARQRATALSAPPESNRLP